MAGLGATMVARPVMAQAIPLAEISAYMNNLEAARARFRQDAPDGSVTSGTFYLKRPGRMRFEYDPPEPAMVIAGGGVLAVFDPRSDEPTRYPLSQTPLSVILARNVNLSRADEVAGVEASGEFTLVEARDPDNPDYGSITLVFSDNPVRLRQWIIRDESGSVTRVSLGELDTGARVPNRLFNIVAETRNWNP
ncbi:MAG: outer membrane lipoprotein carrier protein LolA [Pseudomonadota bacterium]